MENNYFKFNNKYVKDCSTAGSWRRGFEYFQKGQIAEIKFHNNIVRAKVKGNFKSHYETALKFTKKGVEPSCNCPLDEPWCKHVVAVAQASIKNKWYEQFLKAKFDVEPENLEEDFEFTQEPQGGYIFHFNPKRRQNFFSILVQDRSTKKIIRDLEGIFKAVIAAQKENPDFQLNNAQKLEAMLFKMLLKDSRIDKKTGWYDVQINKFDEFFKMLSKMEDVIDAKARQKIILKAIDDLPAKMRKVIIWYEFEDLTYEQIAQKTGDPVGTIKSRLFNARKILGEKLKFLKED